MAIRCIIFNLSEPVVRYNAAPKYDGLVKEIDKVKQIVFCSDEAKFLKRKVLKQTILFKQNINVL